MLKKLFKYEFKSLGRILLPIYGATLIIGIIASLLFKLQPTEIYSSLTILRIMSLVLMVIYIFAVICTVCLSFFIAIYRFKKNIFECEGYFTNTLPVEAWQNIFVKGITAVTYELIGVVVAATSGMLYMLISVGKELSNYDFSYLFYQINFALRQIGPQNIAGYAAEVLVLTITCMLGAMFMFYASISVGHSFNSHRVLKSVGAFIGFYIISQFINSCILSVGNAVAVNLNIVFTSFTASHIFLIGIILLELIYAAAYFAITNYFLKNKLNLQ